MSVQNKLSARVFAQLLRELQDGPATVKELCAVTGMALGSMRRYAKTLYAHRCIHIVGWENGSGGPRTKVPVYKLGEGVDAEKPRLTQQQKDANYSFKRTQAYRMKVAQRHILGTTPHALRIAA